MGKYAIYICGGPEPPGPAEKCPVDPQFEHTGQPKGYLAWHEWAEEMAKTHDQIRCGGCDLFKVWVPRS